MKTIPLLLAVVVLLSGCVVVPAYPSYYYYPGWGYHHDHDRDDWGHHR